MSASPLCIDLETHPIAPGQQLPRIVLGAVADGAGRRVLARDEVIEWVEHALRTGETLVNHSIAFDLGCVGAARPDLLPLIFDAYAGDRIGCTHMLTQLYDIGVYGATKGGRREVPPSGASPIDRPYLAPEKKPKKGAPADEEAPKKWWVNLPNRYGLKEQAWRWLGVELEKDERRTTFGQYDGVPIDQIPPDYIEYMQGDLCALDLWHRVHAVADFDLSNVWALSRRDFALRLIEARGRYVDGPMLARQRAKWQAELEEAFAELRELGWVREKRGKQIKTRVLAGYDRRPLGNRKKQWAARWGLRTLTANGLGRAIADGTVTPRHASLVLDYLREPQGARTSPARQRFFARAGLWQPRYLVERQPGAPTGEWTIHKAAIEAEIARVAGQRDVARTPKTGVPQITEANTFEDPRLEKAVLYARARGVAKYLEKLESGVDQPLHLRVSGLAATGRTTSGGDDDGEGGVNDQNHRREYGFREVFIPRRGHAYVSIDYAQAELCALAEIQTAWFGRSALADTINAGQDCHLRFVATLLGEEYESVYARRGELKDKRQLGKAYNFGKPGGLAELKFCAWAKQAYGVTVVRSEWSHVPREGYVPIDVGLRPGSVWVARIPEELRTKADDEGATFRVVSDPASEGPRVRMAWLESQSPDGQVYCLEHSAGHLDALFFTSYPETRRYLDRVKAIVRSQDGVVYTHSTGRRRANCTMTSGANNGFQALVADGATEALFRVQRACYADPSSPLYGSCGVWFTHDEIGLEIPLDRLHEAAHEGSRIMVETMREHTPHVRIEAKPAAMRRWTKAADDPRYGADGRLIPEEDWRIANDALKEEERADVLDLFERHGLEVMR